MTMTKTTIAVDSSNRSLAEAIKLTADAGTTAGLDNAQNLRLRLLVEELIGLLRGIAGDLQADYTIEEENKKFTLHLKGEVRLDKKMHDQLIESSTNGKNAAAKGFTGRLREMIGTMLLPGTLGNTFVTGFSMGLMNMGSPIASVDSIAGTNAYLWSMEKYVNAVKESDSKEEWDALERSILVNAADDVKVSIVGNDVEIIIEKQF